MSREQTGGLFRLAHTSTAMKDEGRREFRNELNRF